MVWQFTLTALRMEMTNMHRFYRYDPFGPRKYELRVAVFLFQLLLLALTLWDLNYGHMHFENLPALQPMQPGFTAGMLHIPIGWSLLYFIIMTICVWRRCKTARTQISVAKACIILAQDIFLCIIFFFFGIVYILEATYYVPSYDVLYFWPGHPQAVGLTGHYCDATNQTVYATAYNYTSVCVPLDFNEVPNPPGDCPLFESCAQQSWFLSTWYSWFRLNLACAVLLAFSGIPYFILSVWSCVDVHRLRQSRALGKFSKGLEHEPDWKPMDGDTVPLADLPGYPYYEVSAGSDARPHPHQQQQQQDDSHLKGNNNNDHDHDHGRSSPTSLYSGAIPYNVASHTE